MKGKCFMDDAIKSLARHRLARAVEELNIAKDLNDKEHFAKSLNCSYYAMFHAARALLAIKKLDSKRHSGVLKLFNDNFIYSGSVLKEFYSYLSSAFNNRLQSDYHDFYIAKKEDSTEQIQNAEKFIEMTKNYLSNLWL